MTRQSGKSEFDPKLFCLKHIKYQEMNPLETTAWDLPVVILGQY